ncbi:MAG TPA: DUF5777 family beta-barrel protein [Cyclobacteriaceae bacterium]|nr:DUF5777 family beta-barrel protein [Cyclobacteriaceae bacterium]
MRTNRIPLICLLFLPGIALAQDDLLKELEKESKETTTYTSSTFKGTRLINGQTVETKGEGALEFIFAHRFGAISSGAYELYGLDQAYVRLGLEYGLTDRLGVGIGRNSSDKTMDGYLRYKVARQSSGEKNMPVTITAFGIAAVKLSPKTEDAGYAIELADRMSYTGQLLIARKFNSLLSLQLMPTLVHKNTVDKSIENNDTYAMGIGGRLKVTRSVALTTEYYYRANVPDGNTFYNPVGFGVDIETGGHVFQLVMTNSQGLTERAFLTETTGDFFKGDIHLGFNVTRTFQLKRQK